MANLSSFRKKLKVVFYLLALGLFVSLMASALAQPAFSPGALNGGHQKINKCSVCHEPFRGVLVSKCLNCHSKIAWQAKFKKGLHGGIRQNDCLKCHLEHKDQKTKDFLGPANFDHSGLRFLLVKHEKEKCFSCHKNTYVNFKQNNCQKCHSVINKKFQNHVVNFGQNCLRCHDGLKNKFSHKNKAFFVGKHQQDNCSMCHRQNVFGKISAACLSCHRKPYGHFGLNCSNCHNARGWEGVSFKHSSNSSCESCHRAPANHYGNGCSACHNVSDWSDAQFSHPQIGEHDYRSFSCSTCHLNGYGSYTCAKCHEGNNFEDEDEEEEEDEE